MLTKLRKAFSSRGFDILHPFLTHTIPPTVDGNLQFLCKSDKNQLCLIVGNNKNIWSPFLSSLSTTKLLNTNNPLDEFVEDEIIKTAHNLNLPVTDIIYTHESSISRLISFQKLGAMTNLAHYSIDHGLSLHPEYGAWFAFRAVIVLDIDEDKDYDFIKELKIPKNKEPLPFPCTPETQLIAAEQMQRLIQGIDHDWFALRDTVIVGRSNYIYEEEQMKYHYGGGKSYLMTCLEERERKKEEKEKIQKQEERNDGGDWGLGNDGSRSNIIASNLFTNNPSVTQPIFPEKEWRDLASSHDSNKKKQMVDVNVRLKKIIWTASKRGWAECGEFLIAWIDDGGISNIGNNEKLLDEMEKLLQCDDMFLMGIIWGTKDVPKELNNDALKLLTNFSNKNKSRTM
jgi:succinate dehydrogenase flavin-adding protein (antitoxin of CptAB toxin-antitoxin module)